MNNDTFSYFPAETADPIGKYTQPKAYTVPLNKEDSGYPNNIPNTQTQMTRGGKAQTKGRGHSTKMG